MCVERVEVMSRKDGKLFSLPLRKMGTRALRHGFDDVIEGVLGRKLGDQTPNTERGPGGRQIQLCVQRC